MRSVSRLGRYLAAALVALGAAACSAPADVSGSGGSPIPVATGSAPAAEPVPVAGAPACEGFPDAQDRGLPCLGPGEPVNLATLPGPIVVSVWASWCGPCREELPVLQQWHEQGGEMLGVDVADSPEAAAALLAELGVTFPSVQDTESTTRLDIGWVGPPANVVIVDGQVVYRFTAPITSVAQIERAVTRVGGAA